jgi:hypothetical protein
MARRADLLTVLVASAAVSMMASTTVACNGACDTKQPGATVSFPADVFTTDVAVITATGACGPGPVASSLCQTMDCDAGGAWSVDVPTNTGGVCMIHVALKDGRTFDGTVQVHSSSECGNHTWVDTAVYVTFGGGDAGSTD